jgi:hypothetical protein
MACSFLRRTNGSVKMITEVNKGKKMDGNSSGTYSINFEVT